MSHVILGVGLNINTAVFPDHLQTVATSLRGTGQRYSRLAIIRAFLRTMDVFMAGFYARNSRLFLTNGARRRLLWKTGDRKARG